MSDGKLYVGYDLTGLFKIGITNDQSKRLKQFKTGNPFFAYLFVFDVDNPAVTEIELHTKFSNKNVRGEWFSLTSKDLQWICTKFFGMEYSLDTFERIIFAIKNKGSVVLPELFGGAG